MERYVITMADFLKNAGIVGMEYLLETAGARRDVDYGITEDAQGLWLDREFAENVEMQTGLIWLLRRLLNVLEHLRCIRE